MPDLETAAIRARLEASLARDLWHPALDDVKALLAEVERLQHLLAKRTGSLDMAIASASRRLARAEAAEAALEQVRDRDRLAAVLTARCSKSGDNMSHALCGELVHRQHYDEADTIRAALDGAHPTPSDGSESCACPREWISNGGGCQCPAPATPPTEGATHA